MKRTGRRRPRLPAVALFALGAALGLLTRPANAQEISAATFVRTDSDTTTVVAPRLRANYPVLEGTSIDAVYAVDIWTSASIDIRTSASKVPVTEQRDEFDLSVSHELSDVTLNASYRNSSEPDYQSHGGTVGLTYDFAQNNATLALGATGNVDKVGRAGTSQELWSRDLMTVSGRIAFTQVLGVDTVAMVLYEPQYAHGYQASAYRFVAIGGNVGSCWRPLLSADPLAPATQTGVAASLCPDEANPEDRLRHAMSIRGRHAIDEHMSAGAAYRFYTDNWGITSHTARADLVYAFTEATYVAAGYRLYIQGSANHYRPVYLTPQKYMTSDKELSALSSHRLSFEIEHTISPGVGNSDLTLFFSVAPSIYFYDIFPLLHQIRAIDFNVAATWTF